MDDSVGPLRIPPQMSAYADKHNLFHLLQRMLTSLLTDKPEDPISYLIRLLQTTDVPKIMLLGPPAVGKHSVAKKLSAELGVVHVTTDSLLDDQSELSTQAREYTLTQQEVPAELLIQLIKQRLNGADCFSQGWVMEGIPQNYLQGLMLQQAGVCPKHVVLLEAPDDVLVERARGRMVDPQTGDIYHQSFLWPADDAVAERLEKREDLTEEQRLAEVRRYRCEVTTLAAAYQDVLKVVNSDQPITDVYQQVVTFVKTRRYYRTPRVLLLGPPGSGKSHQARQLSNKYKMVDVSCSQLLRAAAADGSAVGAEIQSYLVADQPVPDSLVLKVLDERLSRLDCASRGWILHGFPKDLEQGKSLEESQHQPNRVYFLEVTDDVCLDRITLKATDPVTGERYHALTRPAPNSEVQKRLKTRPQDSVPRVTLKLKVYRRHAAGLRSIYPDAVHIEGDQDFQSVFEALESRLTAD
ncbi:adenylate kinase 8 [Antennarius striatus]|uniref:adenylate kinase 8 n=1 Tax=Antennarius striatus TaxID=241820 RepID=UPI0035B337B1